MLDIGGDVGALLVYADAHLLGREPVLTRLDGVEGHVHTAVRERRIGSDVTFAALYPALAAGRYRIDDTGQVVDIAGGVITEVTWSSQPAGDESLAHTHADQ